MTWPRSRRPRQGYGYAIQRGFAEATGDLLIVAEPDGTFLGRDVLKLLAKRITGDSDSCELPAKPVVKDKADMILKGRF